MSLYDVTLQWMHYDPAKMDVRKTDIANYWLESHDALLGGASGDALTDAVVFFLRIADLAGVGKFVSAGKGRDSHIKLNREALAGYVSGSGTPAPKDEAEEKPPPPPPDSQHRLGTTLSPGLQVNVEIHIAADAEPSTIEEIFKNMRKYVLSLPDETATP